MPKLETINFIDYLVPCPLGWRHARRPLRPRHPDADARRTWGVCPLHPGTNLRAIGVDDLPKNGAGVLFGVHAGGGPRENLPAGLGVSKQAVSQVVDVLVQRGYLHRLPTRPTGAGTRWS